MTRIFRGRCSVALYSTAASVTPAHLGSQNRTLQCQSVCCQTYCLSLLLSVNKTNLHNDDVKNDAAGKESFLLLLLGLFEQVNRLDQITVNTRNIFLTKYLQSMPKMGGDDDKEKTEESAEGKAEKEAAEKAAAAEKKELERQRKEMYEKQKLDRKEERAKYREKVLYF